MARPKKEISLLPKGWEEEIISLYKTGASDVEIKALIYDWLDTFSDSLWYRWLEEEPEFSRTIKKGKFLSQAWWEKQGRDGVWTDTNEGASRLNSTLWFMNMKNRFKEDWRDKHETQEEKEQNIPKIQVEVITKKDGEDS